MRVVTTGVVAVLAMGAFAAPAQAVDSINTKPFRDAVTVSGILGHERVLQRIANQNGGTRASGTPGFTASANYVKSTMKAAGYGVREQVFTFPFFRDVTAPTLSQVSPTPTDYATATFTYSGSGSVTGEVVPTTDVKVPPSAEPSSTSGCESGDFPAVTGTEPKIALIQRGTCTFEIKRDNAAAAGYSAVIIFNEGQAGRTDLLTGTLGTPGTLPVVGLSFEDGAALYAATQAGPVTVALATDTETNLEAKTSNIIAETPGGNPDKVIVVGAHLDSVVAGPGINDNGSGTAGIMEIALQMSKLKITPTQKVRFIFFGAEEAGLLGSEYYVGHLSDANLDRIYANLNFDMIGSPNFARLVYDGDGSATGVRGPAGSAQIEQIFNAYFGRQKLPVEPTAFDGRSDYGPFIDVGIPAGGLFSGAEVVKTPEQVALYGGTAGVAFDRCYHQACDTVDNLNVKALDQLGDAAAHATLTLALTRAGLFPDGSRVPARTGVTTKATSGGFAAS